MSTLSTGARLVPIICFLALFGAGCRGTGSRPVVDPDTTSSTAVTGPEGVACRHEYYPIVPSYRALYQTSINGVSTGSYILSVAWVRDNQAYLAARFASPGDSVVVNSNQQFRCSRGALEAIGYIDTGALQPGGASYNNARVQTNSTSGSFFPERVVAGTEWESAVNITMTYPERTDAFEVTAPIRPVTIDVVTHKKAIGLETIDLPIGRREAMRIEVSVSFGGLSTFSKTEWWVKDIGMVKSLSYSSLREEDPPTLTQMEDYVVPGI
ncbi:hypothetical protein KBB27_00120 [Patescibacteria group bacterium]|nr:hypothetical protein [Patescibacteria group bacterium]